MKGDKHVVFLPCQEIPECSPDFDYFSFCDCNKLDGEKQTGVIQSTWHLEARLLAAALDDVVFAYISNLIRVEGTQEFPG